jgi:hypothetical protein
MTIEGDQALVLPDLDSLLKPTHMYVVLGIIFFSAAVASTCAGKTYGQYGGWAYRIKEPAKFWWAVAAYYLGGILFFGMFLYSIN